MNGSSLGHFQSAQIFISGECPLNCNYCWISKSKLSPKIHKEIRNNILSEDCFNKLESVTGSGLKVITLFGAEPALSLDVIGKKLSSLTQRFPELQKISFYTSLVHWKPVFDFIEKSSTYGLDVEIRISLDGPSFVTKKTNKSELIEKVPENFISLVSCLQKIETKVNFRWKSTLSMESIKEMVQDEMKIGEYIDFFQKINFKFDSINKNSNVILRKDITPWVASFSNYSKKDGEVFAEFLRKARKKNLALWKNSLVAEMINEGKIRPKSASCFGGVKSVSIGENLHICQRTFLLERDDYVEDMVKGNNFSKKDIDILRKGLIPDFKNQNDLWSFEYLAKVDRDFLKFKVENLKNMVKEMAKLNQVDKKYLEDEWAVLLVILSKCLTYDLLLNKSIHLVGTSPVKLFGNGALEEMVKFSLEND